MKSQKQLEPQYIRPTTANQSKEQKRLMTAVSRQQRGSTKAKSKFIEKEADQLNTVSNLNMIRAKEIKD